MLEILKTYQYFLDDLPFGVFWRDKNFVYLGCNKFHAEKAGLSLEEVIGKTDYDLCWKEHAKQHQEDDQQVIISQKKYECIEEIIYCNGNRVWCKIVKLPLISNNEIMGIICIWQDLTGLVITLDILLQALTEAAKKIDKIHEKLSLESKKIFNKSLKHKEQF
jgi:PAS domain S-box-containing protein